jgi:hypothetical protein
VEDLMSRNIQVKCIESLENERITTEKRLEFLRTEVKELKGVAAAKDQQKAR